MPKSNGSSAAYASIVIAVVATILVLLGVESWNKFSAYKNHHIEQREEEAKDNHADARKAKSPCWAAKSEKTIVSGLECLAEKIASQPESKNAQYDLEAQQDMAEWAFAIVGLTVFGLFITTCGTIGIFFTLRETRRTNDITRESSRDQSRAYVSATKVELYLGGSIADAFYAHIFIANSGNTPAVWFEISYGFLLTELNEKGIPVNDRELTDVKMDEKFVRWSSLSAGEELSSLVQPTNFEAFGKQMLANRERIAIDFAGTIRYKTVFNEVYETDFWYMLRRPRGYKMEVVEQTRIGRNVKEIPQVLAKSSGKKLRSFDFIKISSD